jgi:hypothetical protein|nr:MAG TPA: hypothetical protein [Caudoviricetes sp.]
MKIYDVPASPYRLILHNHPPASSIKALCQLMSHKIIGHIYDKENRKRVVDIVLDQDELIHSKNRLICTSIPPNHRPYILIGNIFFEKLVTEKQGCLFMIFHEVGHIVLNHYQKYAAITKDRKKLPPGTVISPEREADAFAAQLLGTDLAIKALQELWDSRSHAVESEITHKKALKEIEARIQLLKKQ